MSPASSGQLLPDGQPASTLTECQEQLELSNAEIQDAETRMQALLRRQAALVHAQRLLQHRHLVTVLKDTNLGFTAQDRPIAAMIVHRCLLQWHALFVTDSATQAFLHSLITVVTQALDEDHLQCAASNVSTGSAGAGAAQQATAAGQLILEPRGEGRGMLALCAYWLTVTSSLLALLHRQVPEHASYLAGLPAKPSGATPRRPSHLGTALFSMSSASGGAGEEGSHGPTAAAAVTAKQIADKLANTLSNFGRTFLRRGSNNDAGAHPLAAALGAAPAGVPLLPSQPPLDGISLNARGSATSGAPPPPPPDQAPNAAHPPQQAGAAPSPGALPADSMEPTPAQVFRHSLDLLLLQAYASCRDSIKKSLAHLLPACIQVPPPPQPSSPPTAAATPPATSIGDGKAAGSSSFGREASAVRHVPVNPDARFTLDEGESDGGEDRSDGGGAAQAGQGGKGDKAAAAQAEEAEEAEAAAAREAVEVVDAVVADALKPPGPLCAWEELVGALQDALQLLRSQHLPRILIKCIFKQLLAFVDAQLFNQLLLRPDCCCASNARHVLSGLKLLDTWVVAGSADSMMKPLYQELRHVRQAATFLMTPGKAQLTLEDITGSLCPALTAQQIYRLCTTYWDDASTAPPEPIDDTPPTPTPPTPPHPPTAPPKPTTPSAADTVSSLLDLPDADADAVLPAGEGAVPQSSPRLPPRASVGSVAAGAVADLISGEVLEALKEGSGGTQGSGVQGNGGLIVTFLLDDSSAPIIAPDGFTAPEVLTLIEGKELYATLELPARHFDTPTVPRDAFEFVESALPLPPHLASK